MNRRTFIVRKCGKYSTEDIRAGAYATRLPG